MSIKFGEFDFSHFHQSDQSMKELEGASNRGVLEPPDEVNQSSWSLAFKVASWLIPSQFAEERGSGYAKTLDIGMPVQVTKEEMSALHSQLDAIYKRVMNGVIELDDTQRLISQFIQTSSDLKELIDSAANGDETSQQLFRAKSLEMINKLNASLADLDKTAPEKAAQLRADLRALKADLDEYLPALTAIEKLVNSLYSASNAIENMVNGYLGGMKDVLLGLSSLKNHEIDEIINRIKSGEEISEADLLALNDLLDKHEQENQLKLQEAQTTLVAQLQAFMAKYPQFTEGMIRFLALAMGMTLNGGGAQGGAAFLLAANNAMRQLLPQSNSAEEQKISAEKIAQFVVEVAAAYYLKGPAACLVVVGNGAFQVFAPEHVQIKAETAAVGLVAGQVGQVAARAGVSPLYSWLLGMGSFTMLRNLKLTQSFYRDFRAAIFKSQENPWMLVPNMLKFGATQLGKNFKAIRIAAIEGRTAEVAVRVGIVVAVVFAGMTMGTMAALVTFMLSPLIFYFLNKAFSLKYEGNADLNNPKFREYLVNTYNKAQSKEKLLEILREELEEYGENPLLKAFIDRLEKKLQDPEVPAADQVAA